MKKLRLPTGHLCEFDWIEKNESKMNLSNLHKLKENAFFACYQNTYDNLYNIEVKSKHNTIAFLIFDSRDIVELVFKRKIIFINTNEYGLLYYFYLQNKELKNYIELDRAVEVFSSDYFNIYELNEKHVLIKYEIDSELYDDFNQAKLLNEDLQRLNIEDENIKKA